MNPSSRSSHKPRSRVRVRATVRGRRWSSVRVRVRRWSRVRVTVRIRRWPGVRVRFQVRIRVSGKCLLNIRGIEAMAEGTCTCPVPNHPESPSAITPIHDSITTIVNNNAHLEGSDSRVSMKMPSRVILAWAWDRLRHVCVCVCVCVLWGGQCICISTGQTRHYKHAQKLNKKSNTHEHTQPHSHQHTNIHTSTYINAQPNFTRTAHPPRAHSRTP